MRLPLLWRLYPDLTEREERKVAKTKGGGGVALNKESTSAGFILKMAFYHQKYHPSIYSVLQQNDSMQLLTAFTENGEIYPLFFVVVVFDLGTGDGKKRSEGRRVGWRSRVFG